MRDTEGCVEELDQGKRYRIYWWEPTPDGRKRRRSKTLRCSRREAHEEKNRMVAASKTMCRATGYSRVFTLADAFEKWYVPHLEADRSPRYLRNMRSVWGKWISKELGQTPLASLRRTDVQVALDGMTRDAARMSMILVTWCVNHALVRGVIDSSDVVGVRYEMPSSVGEPRDWRVLTLADGEELLSLRWRYLEPAVILQLHGGLRVGESLGVEVDATEAVNGGFVAYVEQAVGESASVVALKNRQSMRPVAVVGRWGERLAELRDEAVARGQRYLTERPWAVGKPMGQRDARVVWHAVTKGTRFEGIPMKNLRNSYSTIRQWEMGMSAEKVAKTMGQLSVDVNQRHYNRPSADQLVAEALRAEKMVRDSPRRR